METKVGQDESNSKMTKIFKEVSNRPAPPPFCSTPPCCASCPCPCRSLQHHHGLVGSSSWWGAALLPRARMSIKWNRFSEVPQITVKLVGLKHWEVRAAWFLGSGILCHGGAAVPGGGCSGTSLQPQSRAPNLTGSSNSTNIVLFLQSFLK